MNNTSIDEQAAFYLRELVAFNRRRGIRAWMQGIDFFRCIEYACALVFLLNTKGDWIVDLGSGGSLLPYYVAYKGHRVLCADLNIEQLEKDCSYWLKSLNLSREVCRRIYLQKQDATQLTLNAYSCANISCISVIEHIPDNGDIAAAKELGRVLAPDGTVVISLPYGKWEEQKSFYHGTSFYQRCYDDSAIDERIVEPSGLKLIEKIYFCNRFFNFEKIIWRRLSQQLLDFLGWLAPVLSPLLLLPRTTPCASANGAMLVLQKSSFRNSL